MDNTNEILTRLDQIEAKMGEGTEYLWPKLVEQQVVEGYFALGWAAIGLLFFVVACTLIGYIMTKDPEWAVDRSSNRCTDAGGFAILISAVIGIISLMVGLVNLSDVSILFTPEASALQELLKVVGS